MPGLTEDSFKLVMRSMIDEIVNPYINERVEMEVRNQIRTYFNYELPGEAYHAVAKAIAEVVKSCVHVNLEVTDVS